MSRTTGSSVAPEVALVTGASRGAGKGIALALGAKGMTVYLTGRSLSRSLGRLRDTPLPGTLMETAAAVSALGGQGIALECDHRDDAAVEAAVARIATESGRLDLVVNNATSIHDALIDPGGFWEKPLELADILDVGLRSAYVVSYFAAPLMVRARRGLIAFVSSFGASCYMHGPAYGAQAGLDKFAADMAVDLAPHGVAALSLWLGPQLTERTAAAGRSRPEQYAAFLSQAETPQFNGRIIYALLCDPELPGMSGQTLISAEVAHRYGITEEGGREPPSYREMLGAPRAPHPAKVQ